MYSSGEVLTIKKMESNSAPVALQELTYDLSLSDEVKNVYLIKCKLTQTIGKSGDPFAQNYHIELVRKNVFNIT